MHEEWVKLVDGHSLFVPRREWIGLRVGGEGPLRESTKESHHGQIHFPMPSVCGWVEDRRAPGREESVPSPQVAMNASGRLHRTEELLQVLKKPLESSLGRGGQEALSAGKRQLHFQTFAPKKIYPSLSLIIFLPKSADEVWRGRAVLLDMRRMEQREPPAERF